MPAGVPLYCKTEKTALAGSKIGVCGVLSGRRIGSCSTPIAGAEASSGHRGGGGWKSRRLLGAEDGGQFGADVEQAGLLLASRYTI